jgi:TRAP-type C4-dicarboxylate transport system permease small subunit
MLLKLKSRLLQMDRWLAGVERGLTVVCFTTLILAIGINIVTRNLLHVSSYQILELAPVLVLWVSLLGASLAVRKQRHIKIELLLRFVSPPWRRLCTALTQVFGLLVTALLAYAAFTFVSQEIQLFGLRGAMSICFPLFFLSAFFRMGLQLITQWPGPLKG